jgi:hypothetical protein
MAALRGHLHGDDKPTVTRLGHRHIDAGVSTWNGSVEALLTADGHASVVVRNDHHGARRVWEGNVEATAHAFTMNAAQAVALGRYLVLIEGTLTGEPVVTLDPYGARDEVLVGVRGTGDGPGAPGAGEVVIHRNGLVETTRGEKVEVSA